MADQPPKTPEPEASPPSDEASAPAQSAAVPPAAAAVLAQLAAATARIGAPYVPPIAGPGIQLTLPGIIQQAHWQGPYPPPEAVERYEKILPGALDRMIAMAERLQAAQIDETRRVHEFTQRDSRRGHWLGWSTTAFAMCCAIGCLYFGSQVVAIAFLSVPVMAVAKALVESVKSQSPADIIKAAAQAPPSGPPAAAPNMPATQPAPRSS
jgi:uncharacterized membrane protein